MRTVVFVAAAGSTVLALAAAADAAHACGGCFEGPTQNGDPVTAHRMIFEARACLRPENM